MVTGVSHELSNPLTSILDYSQRLLLRNDLAARTEEVRQIYQEAERASTILRQLLLTARETRPERKLISLNQAVYAPVVVIGDADRQTKMSGLVGAGLADYVVRKPDCLSVALGLVERRLRKAQLRPQVPPSVGASWHAGRGKGAREPHAGFWRCAPARIE